MGDWRRHYRPLGGLGSSQASPGLERKSDSSPFGDLPSIRLVSM